MLSAFKGINPDQGGNVVRAVVNAIMKYACEIVPFKATEDW